MRWRLVFTDRAPHDLRRPDRTVAARALDALERFAADGTGDVTRLRGGSEESRLRVVAGECVFNSTGPKEPPKCCESYLVAAPIVIEEGNQPNPLLPDDAQNG